MGVKKNPQSPMYTQLGVLTKGTVIEVNVSELGMVTTGGKAVVAKYAQVTNNPVSFIPFLAFRQLKGSLGK
jgi:ribosome biogenesis protein NSA2